MLKNAKKSNEVAAESDLEKEFKCRPLFCLALIVLGCTGGLGVLTALYILMTETMPGDIFQQTGALSLLYICLAGLIISLLLFVAHYRRYQSPNDE